MPIFWLAAFSCFLPHTISQVFGACALETVFYMTPAGQVSAAALCHLKTQPKLDPDIDVSYYGAGIAYEHTSVYPCWRFGNTRELQ